MLLTNGRIHTMAGEVFDPGFVQIADGLIVAAGPMSDLPKQDGDTLDAEGAFVFPGLIDAHAHLGVWEENNGPPGVDTNEMTDPVTPHLRALDAVNPQDSAFAEALSAGVTTVCIAPGSANAIGGQMLAMSTHGIRVDDMIIKEDMAMKMALGENPKRVYGEKSRSPMTRMATAAFIREALSKAGEYLNKKDAYLRNSGDAPESELPEFNMKMEALLPVVDGDMQAHIHAHRLDDIFTAIRIAKEFDLDLTIVHGTEAHLAAAVLAAESARVITGPTMISRTKVELSNLSYAAAGILDRAGVLVAISTDHPEVPAKHLCLAAALAAKDGMSEEAAMRAITINAAQCCGIDDLVGSIEPEKRADIALFDKHPLDLTARVTAVFVGGERVR